MKKDLIWVNPHSLKGYEFNWEKAFRYAKLMEKGIEFPPVRVHQSLSGELIVKNGMHRTIAAKLCGTEVLVEVATKDIPPEELWDDWEWDFKIR